MASLGKALGGDQAFGGYLFMFIKDAFEMVIIICHGERTELVKDASNLNAIITMG
jgi:hypothetical protein